MSIQNFKSSQLITSRWSGGTTTQLFIYPPEADYAKRNFLFRISTATTEAEESDFTILPGVARQLMVLEGKLQLIHEGTPGATLNKFDVAEFSGNWQTKGIGKVIDFNLMLKEPAKGNISALILETGIKKELKIPGANNFTGLYILKGSVKIILKNESIFANEHDFISIPDIIKEKLILLSEQTAEVIQVNIIY